MPIIYREARREDIKDINNLFIELIKTVNKRMQERGIQPYEALEEGFGNDFWEKFFDSEDKKILVAEDYERVIGFLSIINHKDYLYLDDYSVNENYRGKGIGSKLMSMAEEYAKENGISNIRTHVESANYESISFYKNRGFKIKEQEDHRLLITKEVNMTNEVNDSLIRRNKEIIIEVKNQIDKRCPDSVDMIAITGSFASGDFYEKSDLDLLIIKNDDKVEEICTTFIMDDVGFDIFTNKWEDLEKLAKYKSPFVKKLKNIEIVYSKDEEVSNRYKEIQQELNKNMNDDELIKENISDNFAKVLTNYGDILNCEGISDCYNSMGKFMINVESIIYLMNKTYVKHGTKNIPEEIKNMPNLPDGFLDNYLKLIDAKNINEIFDLTTEVFNSVKNYIDDNDIEMKFEEDEMPLEKRELTSNDLTGSYEELYSNYFNKLIHASETNNKYLSFRTMINAQSFLDKYSNQYDMPSFDLIGNYNPDSLVDNSKAFGHILNEWKSLYDTYHKKVNIVSNVKEIYDAKRPFVAYETDVEKEFFSKKKMI